MGRRSLAVATALLALALTGCGGGSKPTAAPPGDGSKPTVSPKPVPSPLAAKVAAPVGLAVAGGGLWAVNSADGTVMRIDPASGKALRTVAVGKTPLRAAGDGDTLWVTVFGDNKLVKVDAKTGKVTATAPVPAGAEGVAVGFDAVWVVSQDGKQVTRFDRSGRELSHVAITGTPRLVAIGTDAVFVSDYVNGSLNRLDKAGGTVEHSPRLCDGAQAMAALADVLWVACTQGNEVIAVDQRSFQVLGRVAVPGEPDGLRIDDGVLWVGCATGPALVAVTPNPTAPVVTKTMVLNGGGPLDDRANIDVESYDGHIWVSSFQEDGVYRTTP